MNLSSQSPTSVYLSIITFFICLSCSKDSDLFTEVVIEQQQEQMEETAQDQEETAQDQEETADNNDEPNEISNSVQTFKGLFDAQTLDDDYQLSLANSGDGGDIYYLDVSPYVYMFQATGEDAYMDFAVNLFETVIAQSVNVSDGYKGWPDDTSGVTRGVGVNNGIEVSLPEGRGFRTVARMLWVLHGSPSYRAKGGNQSKYESMLAWFQDNIWDKWESRGIGNFYRSRTHMSSHWGQIAWFLHEITSIQKYRDVYENWSFRGFPSGTDFVGQSMRNNLRTTSLSGGNGYNWDSVWGGTGSNDVSHANAEVELMVLGAEHGDYWTLSDMENLVKQFDQNIFNSAWDSTPFRIDGSGSSVALWDQGWVQLGRFDESLQEKLESVEVLPTFYYQQKIRIANLAYNRAFLEDNLYYPEAE